MNLRRGTANWGNGATTVAVSEWEWERVGGRGLVGGARRRLLVALLSRQPGAVLGVRRVLNGLGTSNFYALARPSLAPFII